MQDARAIKAGDIDVAVAGGMENMDLAPHFAHVRGGVKYGPATMQDHMAHDGLTCAFENWPMGNAAEWVADVKPRRPDPTPVREPARRAARARSTAAGGGLGNARVN